VYKRQNIGEYFVDNATGLPLAGGTIEYYADEARTIPKNVFELTGSPPNYTYTALPNPIQLSGVGTIVDANGVNVAVYYYPYDPFGNVENYYIVVKNAQGVIQLTRQAWPNITTNTGPIINNAETENEISNSQFVDVSFDLLNGANITSNTAVSNQYYNIAPGWKLLVSSSGAFVVEITRNALAGQDNIVTNPPYNLDILPEGANISRLQLVQRLYGNPDIWANSFISSNLVVSSEDGINHPISMLYSPSVAVTPTTLLSGNTGISGYTQLYGLVSIPQGQSTDVGGVGYVDIVIDLPVNGHLTLTSIQVCLSETDTVINYKQDTILRQQDYLFHYYNPLLQQIPSKSLLPGWDFRVNPTQWTANQSIGAVAASYLWDQLIGWQSVNSSISVQKSADSNLEVQILNDCQFALVAYLDQAEMRQLMSDSFSVSMSAYTDNVAGLDGTISFWYTTDATLPNIATGTNLCLVNTLDANGKPATFHGNWVEMTKDYGDGSQFSIPYANAGSLNEDPYTYLTINGWKKTPYTIIPTATFCAVVVGFSSTATSNLFIEYIAATPGLLAVPFQSLSFDETLSQLQRYYQTSYPNNVVPGTAFSLSSMITIMGSCSYELLTIYSHNFGFTFLQELRTNPNLYLYSPATGTIDELDAGVSYTSTHYVQITVTTGYVLENGTKSITYDGENSVSVVFSPTPNQQEHLFMSFHFVADSRLGII
jgi:hypothetical protein